MELNEMIRNARKQAGLTQQQLSDKYKIPVRTLVDWERMMRTPPEYVVDLLLRCMAVDFPMEQNLLQSNQQNQLILTDKYGKPLSQKLAELVRIEYEAGRVEPQPDKQEQDFYGDPVMAKSKGKGKLYQCTHIDLDSEIPFAFEFRIIKEV